MTYGQLYQAGAEQLLASGIQESETDAKLLLYHVCEISATEYLMKKMDFVDERTEEEYRHLIALRCKHIPLQQITGVAPFYGYDFMVNDAVLIPRFDTEILVDTVLKHCPSKDSKILDLCTGSGCIAIALKKSGGYTLVAGSDISEEALEVAQKNGKKLDADILWLHGNLLEPVEGYFDVIVSNPPYIRPEVIVSLDEEVKNHEPYMALFGGEDGLDFYRKIAKNGKKNMVPGGGLFFEIGYDQETEVINILQKEGYVRIETVRDLTGLPRVVFGYLSQI